MRIDFIHHRTNDGLNCARHTNQRTLIKVKRLDDDNRYYRLLYKKCRPERISCSMFQADQLFDRTKRCRPPSVYALYDHSHNDNRIESDNRHALAKLVCPGH